MIFSDQYTYLLGWPEERMAQLYNAFDVLSLASSGEGFGIPLIEAQACGVPVVSCAQYGHDRIDVRRRLHHASSVSVVDGVGVLVMIPQVGAIVDAYEDLYRADHAHTGAARRVGGEARSRGAGLRLGSGRGGFLAAVPGGAGSRTARRATEELSDA